MKFLQNVAIVFCLGLTCFYVQGTEARVVKVLPQYIDKEGRNSKTPSLIERDVYQKYLKNNPDKCSGIRFNVQWKASKPNEIMLKIEMIGSKDSGAKVLTVEKTLKKETFFGHWTTTTIEGEKFRKLGEVIAWRATLWRGDKLLSEQKSFLWQ